MVVGLQWKRRTAAPLIAAVVVTAPLQEGRPPVQAPHQEDQLPPRPEMDQNIRREARLLGASIGIDGVTKLKAVVVVSRQPLSDLAPFTVEITETRDVGLNADIEPLAELRRSMETTLQRLARPRSPSKTETRRPPQTAHRLMLPPVGLLPLTRPALSLMKEGLEAVGQSRASRLVQQIAPTFGAQYMRHGRLLRR